MGKKIATCSYCGTRAVLVLDRVRHELTCSACGAPLHDMKFMPQPHETKKKDQLGSKAKPKKKPQDLHSLAGHAGWFSQGKKSVKKKKRKPMFRRVLEDIWDEVEDIFD
jgi:transcription initiation factor TFIIIB Brf1 subunit/transcription initiation factor TFIIB